MSDDLSARLKAAAEAVKRMSPEEYAAMMEAQRQSWVRGMTARCEHGELDFEQCVPCREAARKRMGAAK